MTNTAPQQPQPTNGVSFADLLQMAQQLGHEAGRGKDTQIRFLMSMVEGGYHNALDLTPNKHGTDKDDAAKLTEEYVTAQQKAVSFDAKAANQRVAMAKTRTCIKLGGWTKGGVGEPLASVNNLMHMRSKLRQNPAEAKKLDDAANTLLNFARAQLKRDTLMSDDEIKEFCYKKQNNLPGAEQIIENAVKALDKLIDGTASSSTVQDSSPEVINARQELRKRLTAIATARGKANGPNPLSKLTV